MQGNILMLAKMAGNQEMYKRIIALGKQMLNL